MVLIQIIKWMPSYWDNKALPTTTLTLPDTFVFTLLILDTYFNFYWK